MKWKWFGNLLPYLLAGAAVIFIFNLSGRKLGLLSVDGYNGLIDLPSIKDSGRLRGRALSQEEITALMSVCQKDPTATGKRDLALIAILRGTGLRRAISLRRQELYRYAAGKAGKAGRIGRRICPMGRFLI